MAGVILGDGDIDFLERMETIEMREGIKDGEALGSSTALRGSFCCHVTCGADFDEISVCAALHRLSARPEDDPKDPIRPD